MLQAVILGVVQGLTEFLPVSSSAHLAIVPWLAGWSFEPHAAFLFDVLVQLGTLVPLLVIFRADLARILLGLARVVLQRGGSWSGDARLGLWVVVGTLPAAAIGLLVRDQVEAAFAEPRAVFVFLLMTGLILVAGEQMARRQRDLSQLSAIDAILVGLAQALALFPGISRSGATIATGRARGFARAEAARFSFLLAIPALAGAGLVAATDLGALAGSADLLLPIVAGTLTSAFVGYLAIRWLLAFLARRSLHVFAIYCVAIAIAGLVLSAVRG
ncbi:MAG: undecaprenyl-diphosphatase UppP [Anaerolineales bacterium]